jgi:hypothetical protein
MGTIVLFGIAQDMVTVRLSREYFTIAHDPRMVPFDDPTLMALGWGIRATAGPGAIVGIVVGLIGTLGPQRPLQVSDILSGLLTLVAIMAWTTLVCGFAGNYMATVGQIQLGGPWNEAIAPERQVRFFTVGCAHLGAYASGIIGGVAFCFWAGWKRGQLARL